MIFMQQQQLLSKDELLQIWNTTDEFVENDRATIKKWRQSINALSLADQQSLCDTIRIKYMTDVYYGSTTSIDTLRQFWFYSNLKFQPHVNSDRDLQCKVLMANEKNMSKCYTTNFDDSHYMLPLFENSFAINNMCMFFNSNERQRLCDAVNDEENTVLLPPVTPTLKIWSLHTSEGFDACSILSTIVVCCPFAAFSICINYEFDNSCHFCCDYCGYSDCTTVHHDMLSIVLDCWISNIRHAAASIVSCCCVTEQSWAKYRAEVNALEVLFRKINTSAKVRAICEPILDANGNHTGKYDCRPLGNNVDMLPLW